MNKYFSILPILLCFGFSIHAQTCPSSAANDFNVTETAPPIGETCTVAGNHTQGVVTINFRTLTIDGTLTINGNFTIYDEVIINGILNVNGDLTMDSNANLVVNSGGQLNVSEDFNNGGALTINNVNETSGSNGGEINVGGDYNNNSGSNMTVSDGGSMNVDGNFYSDPDGNFTVEDGGDVNTGSFSGDTDAVDVQSGGSFNEGSYPLPVELIDFNGFALKGQNVLNWSTASELNNDGFQIEKSKNGLDYSKVGFVSGHGTSNVKNNYEYHDQETGTAYYRLVQIDFDGQSKTYNPIRVTALATPALEVHPTLISNTATIHLPASIEYHVLYLANMEGKIITQFEGTVDSVQDEFNKSIRTLHKGNYVLVAASFQGQNVVRFIKQ